MADGNSLRTSDTLKNFLSSAGMPRRSHSATPPPPPPPSSARLGARFFFFLRRLPPRFRLRAARIAGQADSGVVAASSSTR